MHAGRAARGLGRRFHPRPQVKEASLGRKPGGTHFRETRFRKLGGQPVAGLADEFCRARRSVEYGHQPERAQQRHPTRSNRQRIRALRLESKLSQGDIERTTGLRRQYLSRIENGRTLPSIETLEKLALAMQVPLYVFFHSGKGKVTPPRIRPVPATQQDGATIRKVLQLVPRMSESDRLILVAAAKKMFQLQRMSARRTAF